MVVVQRKPLHFVVGCLALSVRWYWRFWHYHQKKRTKKGGEHRSLPVTTLQQQAHCHQGGICKRLEVGRNQVSNTNRLISRNKADKTKVGQKCANWGTALWRYVTLSKVCHNFTCLSQFQRYVTISRVFQDFEGLSRLERYVTITTPSRSPFSFSFRFWVKIGMQTYITTPLIFVAASKRLPWPQQQQQPRR